MERIADSCCRRDRMTYKTAVHDEIEHIGFACAFCIHLQPIPSIMHLCFRHIVRCGLAVQTLLAVFAVTAQEPAGLAVGQPGAEVSAVSGAAEASGAPAAASALRKADTLAAAPAPASTAVSAADTLAAVPRVSFQDRYRRRGITELSNIFVPRGQWVLGASVSYSTHTNNDYTLMVIEGIDSEGYTFRVSPMVAYALRSNMALGLRATYGRTNLTIDKADLTFGDEVTGTEIVVDRYKSVRHSYVISAIWRQYIPLGRSKRFALFNEMSLGAGGSQSIFAAGQPVKGTYETGYTLALGISPGLMAFASNDVAIEVNVGVMGVSYSRIRQVHNQVTVGHRSTSGMNFKVNIFTIEVGVAFYL